MSERRPIHTCNLCQAMWEGPVAPPATCPGCGSEQGWTAAEVGSQHGMVGGRVFVPGTDTPMTRIFFCKGCKGMTVVRRGGPKPEVCPKCQAPGEVLEEAAIDKPKEVLKPAFVGGEEAARVKQHAALAALQKANDEVQRARDLEVSAQLREVNLTKKPAILLAEDYRKEWIAERVTEWFAKGALTVPGTPEPAARAIWDEATAMYDEGKKRGMLP